MEISFPGREGPTRALAVFVTAAGVGRIDNECGLYLMDGHGDRGSRYIGEKRPFIQGH